MPEALIRDFPPLTDGQVEFSTVRPIVLFSDIYIDQTVQLVDVELSIEKKFAKIADRYVKSPGLDISLWDADAAFVKSEQLLLHGGLMHEVADSVRHHP